MNWVIRMCWLLWHRIIRQDSRTLLSACHTGLPGTMAFMASYLLGVPNDPVQQVFFSMLTPYQNYTRQTNKPVLGLNTYILYSDWLLIGSNPEVFPEFYLHKVVLVSLLQQNSFWVFCDIVEKQENGSQGLATTICRERQKNYCYLLYFLFPLR